MPHFPKPAEGSWTEHYPDLGTAPISFEDSINPEFFELERKAIFERSWLNVGRVEMLPKKGSFFTKEIAAARTSVIVVKTTDGQIRAYHNMCRHRGNKLVWEDYPWQETKGSCRQFVCKYHAWRYSLDGDLTFVQQESEFFGLDKSEYGLVSVQVDVWEGFIFVNLNDDNTTSLADFLGPLAKGLQGYPFGEMTDTYSYRAEVKANWKLYIDAFTEFYHAPILHGKQYTAEESQKLAGYGYEGLHYSAEGLHAMQSSWGGMAPPKDPMMVKPIERVLRAGNFGIWDKPDLDGLKELPPGLNPGRHRQWGLDSYLFFPNFMIVVWEPGWYLTYNYWPTAYNKHIFESSLYFAPAETARARIQQELVTLTVKEFALQDCNTLEATQTMLESRRVSKFPIMDQEFMIRALHKAVNDEVRAYQQRTATTEVAPV